jgi:hypothetical protein
MAASVTLFGVVLIATRVALLPVDDAALQTAPSEPVASATMALVETWPDGRTNYELTSARRATMWTPRFPRIDGYTPPQGAVPVYAVQFARILVGTNIKVDVSVLLGSAQPPGVPVATVVISPGSNVVVEELQKFGVQPVTLSMMPVAPMTPYLPTVFSVSPRIEITQVELLAAPYPGYRITLRNLGAQDVSNFNVQSYRGADKALSALRRSDDGRPLMTLGGSYTFDMNLTSGPGGDAPPGAWSPRPIDVVEIESVRWADGSHDGTPPFPQIESFVEAQSGRRLQLRRIIEALRAALMGPRSGVELLAAVRSRINLLPDAEGDQLQEAQIAMRRMKAIVVSDIVRFEQSPLAMSNPSVREWVTSLLQRYESWLARLSPP